jgi:hypothetical protein
MRNPKNWNVLDVLEYQSLIASFRDKTEETESHLHHFDSPAENASGICQLSGGFEVYITKPVALGLAPATYISPRGFGVLLLLDSLALQSPFYLACNLSPIN